MSDVSARFFSTRRFWWFRDAGSAHSVHGPSLWPARRFGTLYQTAWEIRILVGTTSDVCWRRIYLHRTEVFSVLEMFQDDTLYKLTYLLTYLLTVCCSLVRPWRKSSWTLWNTFGIAICWFPLRSVAEYFFYQLMSMLCVFVVFSWHISQLIYTVMLKFLSLIRCIMVDDNKDDNININNT